MTTCFDKLIECKNLHKVVGYISNFSSLINLKLNPNLQTTAFFSLTDLRNKLRYLKHLPVTSAFEVCELEMNVPQFLPEVLDEFKVKTTLAFNLPMNIWISSLFPY